MVVVLLDGRVHLVVVLVVVLLVVLFDVGLGVARHHGVVTDFDGAVDVVVSVVDQLVVENSVVEKIVVVSS